MSIAPPSSIVLPACLLLGYIGPGAGFAFLGSFVLLFTAILLALASLATLPLRLAVRAIRRKKTARKPAARRVVVLGLDGLDPRQVRRLMAQGCLPNFSALAAQGAFTDLQTTCPPISPVAWSSFMTGVNPGKHNIFDFLSRDLRTCLPELSSCRITAPGKGRHGRAEIEMLRKSRPFWHVLGEHGVFSTVLRVPITFPPEPFGGLLLAGMCTPDLRGSQGSFTVFETASAAGARATGGERVPVKIEGGRIHTILSGPATADGRLEVPLVIELPADEKRAVVRLGDQRVSLCQGVYSDWVPVTFRRHLRRIRGICRFLLVSTSPFRLYVTPLHIDPARPAMPISHPAYYSLYLAKLNGPYATLGLAEDTWALNEGALDEAAFLRQAYDIHAERENMFFAALDRTRAGVCVCVFDLPDRLQHMYYPAVDPAQTTMPAADRDKGARVIEDLYRRMDALLGRTRAMLGKDAVLFVISDHGFASFRQGVNLNAWLRGAGYLAVKPDEKGAEYLTGVDWSRTRAYSFGLSGIYLNIRGREKQGIVARGEESAALKAELADKLRSLRDPASGQAPVRGVYDSRDVFAGPYADNGPDLVMGYENGYRASWETAVGRTDGEVLAENTRHWCGDHCIDPRLVPGVFLCNRAMGDGAQPHITDLAPTIMDLMGVPVPGYVDGRVLGIAPDREQA